MELTAEQIDSMKAGPEMDALVAERVMGWEYPKLGYAWRPKTDVYERIPEYSTDIAVVWEVVIATGLRLMLTNAYDGRTWRASLGEHGGMLSQPYLQAFTADALTAELAICRAALKTTLLTDGT